MVIHMKESGKIIDSKEKGKIYKIIKWYKYIMECEDTI